ncbi:RNA polymerase II Elongator complex associated protein-like protein Kti12 [Xylogone sp. PMI_703]|nr:RNA polymerase II Elongator complex associated protein-like protein Kti12 [Xylogone sp. PMI_703]
MEIATSSALTAPSMRAPPLSEYCTQLGAIIRLALSSDCHLIIISGYPTSGKTHRAEQLLSYFKDRIASSPTHNLRVHLISDHTLCIPRSVYDLESKNIHERSNNASEKDARATIYAAVKRILSNKDIVILDGANYIKGWRYQLYCEAKAVRTPCCVVHVGTTIEQARKVNEERLSRRPKDVEGINEEGKEKQEIEKGLPYGNECWENLVYRYEEPNAMVRWDSPLFTVVWEDAEPPCPAIWDALIGSDAEGGKKTIRPNQVTILKVASSEDYLYELDRTTQGILNRILEWTKDHPGEGGEIVIEEGKDEDDSGLVVELPANPIGLPALQRLRRQFITLNRQTSVPVKRIRESFVGYLNDSFGSG